ncbi:hypothetical protein PBI_BUZZLYSEYEAR_26 [Mycobacterium phage BuzzLyseyear]|uniref:Glycine-rich domain-containing protein n=1 Tax=Mycobacterium phage BuzzLyseyear TaxID=1536598 RepID=A0A088FPR6_9CAUD|nr:minor tail protein [Mycobacterium phage BuzzLyseyear]AIM50148.1 hypothetical protein PBI_BUZZLYSEYEAR_26 [Mycobacterium phage BuzzLyseyear]
MKVWNGSAFVDPTAFKVWNGTAFVDVELHAWNGSSYDKLWPTFTPFTLENVNLTDEPVPAGASGCWVTLIGGGGSGGTGRRIGAGNNRSGGGGGGGGAKVSRVWVPVSSMGSTYTVVRGLGGAAVTDVGSTSANGKPGNAGGSSLFSSGSVQLTAGGGGAGGGGGSTSGSAGSGGTASAIGVSATVANGSAGGAGDYNAAGGAGVNNTSGGAAGGGGGGGGDGSTTYNGGRGGNVSSDNGGAGGTTSAYPRSGPDQAAGQPGPGGGGDRISAPRPPGLRRLRRGRRRFVRRRRWRWSVLSLLRQRLAQRQGR